MSAAIQLVNHPESPEKRVEKPHSASPLIEMAHEQRLRQALGYIAALQADLQTLREELARAERTIVQKESLLRNAMVREQELRAEMFKG
jgi:transcription elongation GreA/GreB family factor